MAEMEIRVGKLETRVESLEKAVGGMADKLDQASQENAQTKVYVSGILDRLDRIDAKLDRLTDGSRSSGSDSKITTGLIELAKEAIRAVGVVAGIIAGLKIMGR